MDLLKSAIFSLFAATFSTVDTSRRINPLNAVARDAIAISAIRNVSFFSCEMASAGEFRNRLSIYTNFAPLSVSSAFSSVFVSGTISMASFTSTFVNGRNINVHSTLKKVWNMAICVSGEENQRSNVFS